MTDLASAISESFKDALHLVQLEMVVQKRIFEYTQENFNPDYKTHYSDIGGAEGYVTYTAEFERPLLDRSMMDWYAFPFKNGSSDFYTLT